MWEVDAKMRDEREMGKAVEKEKRVCQKYLTHPLNII